jgi:hypothetical protein
LIIARETIWLSLGAPAGSRCGGRAALGGLLLVAEGVAAYTALVRAADTCIAEGGSRSRGQIMADTLVERLTGQAHAGDVPIEIALVMTDDALLGSATRRRAVVNPDEPAHLVGMGRSPLRSRVVSSSTRTCACRCGCAGCTGGRTAVNWSQWTPDAGCSVPIKHPAGTTAQNPRLVGFGSARRPGTSIYTDRAAGPARRDTDRPRPSSDTSWRCCPPDRPRLIPARSVR